MTFLKFDLEFDLEFDLTFDLMFDRVLEMRWWAVNTTYGADPPGANSSCAPSIDRMVVRVCSLQHLTHLTFEQADYTKRLDSQLDAFTDQHFLKIAKSCCKLQYVGLSSMYNLSALTWEAFATHTALDSMSLLNVCMNDMPQIPTLRNLEIICRDDFNHVQQSNYCITQLIGPESANIIADWCAVPNRRLFVQDNTYAELLKCTVFDGSVRSSISKISDEQHRSSLRSKLMRDMIVAGCY